MGRGHAHLPFEKKTTPASDVTESFGASRRPQEAGVVWGPLLWTTKGTFWGHGGGHHDFAQLDAARTSEQNWDSGADPFWGHRDARWKTTKLRIRVDLAPGEAPTCSNRRQELGFRPLFPLWQAGQRRGTEAWDRRTAPGGFFTNLTQHSVPHLNVAGGRGVGSEDVSDRPVGSVGSWITRPPATRSPPNAEGGAGVAEDHGEVLSGDRVRRRLEPLLRNLVNAGAPQELVQAAEALRELLVRYADMPSRANHLAAVQAHALYVKLAEADVGPLTF